MWKLAMSKRNDLLMLAAAGAGAWLAVRAYRSLRAFDFHNKCVLVTGGTRGLGLVLARQLMQQGAHVAVCARDEEEIARARDELAGTGGEVLSLRCDLRDRAQVQELMRAILIHFGRIDVLINNASIIQVGPIETMTY